MQKALQESKRSIHSTRIDTIAGELTPIKPKDVLPINSVSRPAVEDPEYLPDTISELAAAMSALARVVPPEKVGEIYRSFRDIIDTIAPVTRTSLGAIDALNETAAEGFTTAEIMSAAESISDAVRKKISHYKSIGSWFADSKARELSLFVKKMQTLYVALEGALDRKSRKHSPEEGAKLDEEIEKISNAIAEMNKNYTLKIRDEETAFESKSGTASASTLAILEKQPNLTEENRLDIFDDYRRRILELRSSGDSFDAMVAEAVEKRSEKVFALVGLASETPAGRIGQARRELRKKGESAGLNAQVASAYKLNMDLYHAIADNIGDLSHFKFEITTKRQTRELSSSDGQKIAARGTIYEVHLEPYFAPGRVRSVVVPEGETVRYDWDTSDMQYVASFGYVHVYKRYLQMFDGSEIEIRPDVRIDYERIRSDFIDDAAEEFRNQNNPRPVETASSFYDANKSWIIREALDPDKAAMPYQQYKRKPYTRADGTTGYAKEKDQSQKRYVYEPGKIYTRKNTPERAALIIAHHRIDELESEMLSAETPDEQDRRRRLKRSASQERQANADDAAENRDIKRTVSSMFNQTAVSSDTAAPIPTAEAMKSYYELVEKAKESFKLIAEGKVDEMKARGIDLDGFTAPSEEKSRTADKEISDALAQSKAVTQQFSALSGTSFMSNLIASLRSGLAQIARSRIESIEAAFSAATASNPDLAFNDEFERANETRIVAVNELKLIESRAKSTAKNADGTTKVSSGVIRKSTRQQASADPYESLDGISESFARISRMFADTSHTTVSFENVVVSTLEDQVGTTIQEAAQQFFDEKRVEKRFAKLRADATVGSILPVVGRITADLSASTNAHNEGDLPELLAFALKRYGLTGLPDFMPVFVDEDLLNKRNSSKSPSLAEELTARKRAHAPFAVADVLFGTVGAGKLIANAVRQFSVDYAIDTLASSADAVSAGALNAAFKCFDPTSPARKMRAIVNIACRALILSSSKGSGKGAEFELVNRYFDSLTDIMAAGTKAPLMSISHLTKGLAGMHRAVSVDLNESTVGFFVDVTGRHVARVVSKLPGISLFSYGQSTFLDFMDPELADDFLEAENKVTRSIASQLGTGAKTDTASVVRDEVRTHLVEALQEAATHINMNIVPPSGLQVPTEKMSVSTFISRQEDIISSSPSAYAKGVATAAINYAVMTGRVPTESVPFYTPIRGAERVDPDTGKPLLKSGHDFVFRTLPVIATQPAIDDMPLTITDQFMAKIYKIVDMHVLTKISDVFKDGIRKFNIPRDDAARDVFVNHLKMTASVASDRHASRSAASIRDAQVLTTSFAIAPDISPDDLLRLKDKARDFIIAMMIASSGYLQDEVTNKLIAAIESGDEDEAATKKSKVKKPGFLVVKSQPSEYLTPEAIEILDRVDDYIDRLASEAGAEFIQKKVRNENGELVDVVVNAAEASSVAAKRARARIIQQIGVNHYAAIKHDEPLSIKFDPGTGLPDFPPTPREFFDEQMKGIDRVTMNITDPVGYIAKISSIAKKYEELIRDRYGLTSATRSKVPDALETIAKSFPGVVADSRERTSAKINRQQPPDIKHVPHLELNAQTGVIVGLSLPPSADELRSIVDRLEVGVKDFVAKTRAIEVTAETQRKIAEVREDIGSLDKIISAYETTQGLNPVFLRIFEDAVKSLNSASTAVVRSETIRITAAVDKTYLDDVYAACAAEIKRMRQDLIAYTAAAEKRKEAGEDALSDAERQELSDKENIDKAGKLQTLVSAAAVIYSAFSKKSTADGKTTLEIPAASGLFNEIIEELRETHKKVLSSTRRVRRRADQAATRAQETVDRDIALLAERYRKFIKGKTGVSAPQIHVVDTVEDLAEFRNKIFEDRKAELIAAIPEAEAREMSDETSTEINNAAHVYTDSFLSHMIFGVRNADANNSTAESA